MTNGGERLDRIERILEDVAKSQEQVITSQERVITSQDQAVKTLAQVATTLREMAARQHYHDEAFERHDAEMKVIRDAIAADAENIRALVRIAELHHRRLEGLEGGGAA